MLGPTEQPSGKWGFLTNNVLIQAEHLILLNHSVLIPHQRFNFRNQSGLFLLKCSFFSSTKESIKENLKLSFKCRVTS